jgi:UPF0271 protein
MSKKKVIIVDTSAVLSGKPLTFNDAAMTTVPSIQEEIRKGGRSSRNLEYLINTGLNTEAPSTRSISIIKKTAERTGDLDRLSKTDVELLALALDYRNNDYDVTILTDDYSIQNISETLHINFQGLNQRGITKKFKWIRQCPGCRKKYNKNIKTCHICGAETNLIPAKKTNIKKAERQG